MYPIDISTETLWSTAARHSVRVLAYLHGGSLAATYTEADIPEGGLVIRRSTVSGACFAPGECVASEMELRLNDPDGTRFEELDFRDADFSVTVRVTDPEDPARYNEVPMGHFYADEVTFEEGAVVIRALDGLILTDRPAPLGTMTFPMTVRGVIASVCSYTGLTFAGGVPRNGDLPCARPATAGITCRQLLIFACQIAGVCGYMDWNGNFRVGWYEQVPTVTLFPGDVFSKTVSRYSTTVSGVYVRLPSGLEHLEGDESGLVLKIEGNELMEETDSGSAESWAQSLTVLLHTRVDPFTATVLPMPHIYPMDCLECYDKRGNSHFFHVTGVTFTLNGNTELEGAADGSAGTAVAGQATSYTGRSVAGLQGDTAAAGAAAKRAEAAASEAAAMAEQASAAVNSAAASAVTFRGEVAVSKTADFDRYLQSGIYKVRITSAFGLDGSSDMQEGEGVLTVFGRNDRSALQIWLLLDYNRRGRFLYWRFVNTDDDESYVLPSTIFYRFSGGGSG